MEASASITEIRVPTAPRNAVEKSIQKAFSPATPAATKGGRAHPHPSVETPLEEISTATGSGAAGAAVWPAGGPVSATTLRPRVEEVLARERARRPVVVVVVQKVTCSNSLQN